MAWRNGGRRQTGVLLAVALVIGVLSACQPRLDQPAPGQAWEVQQILAGELSGFDGLTVGSMSEDTGTIAVGPRSHCPITLGENLTDTMAIGPSLLSSQEPPSANLGPIVVDRGFLGKQHVRRVDYWYESPWCNPLDWVCQNVCVSGVI